jgi:negative regulator of sigma E activity
MEPSLPDRLEALLMRAFDGEATPGERGELAAVADADPRLAAWAELRGALRAALAVPGPVDIAGDVMAALDADRAWAPLGASLASVLGGADAPPIDLADAIAAQIAAMGVYTSDADAPLDPETEWAPLGAALRDAVRAPAVDLADLVMASIANEAVWAPVGEAVRDIVRAAPPIDVVAPVMVELDPDAELSAYFDGELSSERTAVVAARLLRDVGARDRLAAYASLGESLRDATQRGEDLWPGVADGVGLERDALHGWAAIAAPLKEAFAAIPPIDVAGSVMSQIEPVAVRMPRWASLGGPLLGFALAAAMLFAVLPTAPTAPTRRPEDGVAAVAADLRLATINDAQVEEIYAPGDVVVQVMQFEDGGPTFILVDDPPSGSGVPL